MELNKAAVALAMFPASMREEIVRYVLSRGALAIDEVRRTSMEEVMIEPALGFFKPSLPVQSLVRISRSLRVIMGDALGGQWDVERYSVALSRAGSIPLDEGRRLVTTEIITKDASMLSFARRLLHAVPDLPGPFDDAMAGALGGVLNTLDSITTDSTNDSGDVLYEWSRMGKVLGDLAERAMLVTEEMAFEKAEIAQTDMKDAKDAALQTLPWLARALIGVLGMKIEGGDIDDGDARSEIGDTLSEVGDLLAEARTITPEQGGFGSFLKRVGRVAKKAAGIVKSIAAPLASAVIPGAGLAMSIGKQFLPADRDRQAVGNAAQYANKYPALPLTASADGRGATLTDLVKLMSTLRSNGVKLG